MAKKDVKKKNYRGIVKLLPIGCNGLLPTVAYVKYAGREFGFAYNPDTTRYRIIIDGELEEYKQKLRKAGVVTLITKRPKSLRFLDTLLDYAERGDSEITTAALIELERAFNAQN